MYFRCPYEVATEDTYDRNSQNLRVLRKKHGTVSRESSYLEGGQAGALRVVRLAGDLGTKTVPK